MSISADFLNRSELLRLAEEVAGKLKEHEEHVARLMSAGRIGNVVAFPAHRRVRPVAVVKALQYGLGPVMGGL